jgi:hypothetical protein
MPHMLANNVPLSLRQHHENNQISTQTVCDNQMGFLPDQKSLGFYHRLNKVQIGDRSKHCVYAQLRVATLLTNCFTCLNGKKHVKLLWYKDSNVARIPHKYYLRLNTQ